jgi:hypothetical protein
MLFGLIAVMYTKIQYRHQQSENREKVRLELILWTMNMAQQVFPYAAFVNLMRTPSSGPFKIHSALNAL